MMTLEENITKISERLKKGIIKSEQAVRQTIVDPLLRCLAWPTDDPQVVFPEYSVGGGKVDYALCHPASKPRVFIEAKQVGNIEGAEEQLFGYDSRIRVPIAVLTDGQIWRFFHPTGEGTWKERTVREMDLIAGDSEECAECFDRYLNYESICSGEALKAIRQDYDNLVRQRDIERGLPEAWHALLHEEDEYLLKIVAEKTESLCGHRPDDEQVIAFLKSKELPLVKSHTSDPPLQPGTSKPRKNQPSTRLSVEMPDGEVIESRHAKDTFIEVIEKLGIEKVRSVDPSTVLTSPPDYFWTEFGEYYIHYYPDTRSKKSALEKIAEHLKEKITVKIVAKN